MKSRVSKFYEVKIQYQKMQDDGREKKVTEQYVVEALSFTEAEARITEEMNPCILYTSPSPRDGLLTRMPSSA